MPQVFHVCVHVSEETVYGQDRSDLDPIRSGFPTRSGLFTYPKSNLLLKGCNVPMKFPSPSPESVVASWVCSLHSVFMDIERHTKESGVPPSGVNVLKTFHARNVVALACLRPASPEDGDVPAGILVTAGEISGFKHSYHVSVPTVDSVNLLSVFVLRKYLYPKSKNTSKNWH